MPRVVSLIEAFVRLAACDPLAHFRNWRLLTTALRGEPRPLYRGFKPIDFDQANLTSLDGTRKG